LHSCPLDAQRCVIARCALYVYINHRHIDGICFFVASLSLSLSFYKDLKAHARENFHESVYQRPALISHYFSVVLLAAFLVPTFHSPWELFLLQGEADRVTCGTLIAEISSSHAAIPEIADADPRFNPTKLTVSLVIADYVRSIESRVMASRINRVGCRVNIGLVSQRFPETNIAAESSTGLHTCATNLGARAARHFAATNSRPGFRYCCSSRATVNNAFVLSDMCLPRYAARNADARAAR